MKDEVVGLASKVIKNWTPSTGRSIGQQTILRQIVWRYVVYDTAILYISTMKGRIYEQF